MIGNTYRRTWQLDNISILSRAKGGDGRTVEAYAAIFNSPYEVKDEFGHYIETIHPGSFNRTLSNNGPGHVSVLYNHGYTIHGTPDMLGSVPLGNPKEIRADNRGLLTITRYNESALADAVLEAIRNDDITSQSFRGRIYKSDPMRVPRVRPGQKLPKITRMELGLSDYGPTPIPMNSEPMMVAVRSAQQIAEEVANLDDEKLAELIRTLSDTSLRTRQTDATSVDAELGAEDSPNKHSIRSKLLKLRLEMRQRGL